MLLITGLKNLRVYMKLSIQLIKNMQPPKVIFLRMIASIVITLAFFVIISFTGYAVHEFGHRLVGSVGSFYHTGKLPEFSTTGWDNCTGVSFILCPQQTKMISGVPTAGMAYGGPFLVILTVALVSASLYKRSKNALFVLFPVLYAINEITGNIICGTDNVSGAPLAACSQLPIPEIAAFSILGAALLVFYIVNSEVIARISAKSVKSWFP